MSHITIIGAGLAGISLAYALRDSAYQVTLLDSAPERDIDLNDLNARFIALAYRSEKIFSQWGAWQNLAPYTTSIKSIHVSDRGHFGSTRINAEELGVESLGYSIQAQTIYQILKDNINIIRPATVTSLDDHTGEISYEHEDQTKILASDLIIVADGGGPGLHKLLNIERDEKDYQQTAIVANVTMSQAHHNIAYERFTNSGAIALLPIEQNNMALAWTIKTNEVEKFLQCDDESFLQALQTAFGFRAGRFIKTFKRSSFPLKLSVAKQQNKNKLLLLGNAAHTIHPVSAQGFNLTLRDVQNLSDKLLSSDIKTAVENYLIDSKTYQRQTTRFTDGLIRIFANDSFPLTPLRSLGLAALNNCKPLKNYLAKKIMGYY